MPMEGTVALGHTHGRAAHAATHARIAHVTMASPRASHVARSAARSSASKKKAAQRPPNPKRATLVWASFVAAMTVVGGGLWLADGGRTAASPQGSTATITPLMATSGASSSELDVIYRTVTPVDAGRWQAIVIHDSGDSVGTFDSLDKQARASGLRGVGYHFVIGNGNGMVDGELAICPRWSNQTPGAHTAGPDADWYNRQAIGICLVGDGDRQRFTPAQVRRLAQLVRSLAQRLGIPQDRVYLHSQLAQTNSPGKFFPEATFRAQIAAR